MFTLLQDCVIDFGLLWNMTWTKSVCMSYWQGRIFDMEDEEVIGIRWDSVTLKELPLEYIKKSEKEGLDWAEMYLGPDEIEPASPRETKKQADETAKAMQSEFSWLGDLTVLNKKSNNFLPVQDYCVWFANR